jgi:hypothetical protein
MSYIHLSSFPFNAIQNNKNSIEAVFIILRSITIN